MTYLLVTWALAFVSLSLSLLILHLLFRLLGPDLGLKSWKHALAICASVSLVQAGAVVLPIVVMGSGNIYFTALAFVLACVLYRATHLQEMSICSACVSRWCRW